MLMYRPNIKEIENALDQRKPFRNSYYFDTKDNTNGLFRQGKMESMINNIFIFDKKDITDIAILSEMSIYGFSIIETMNNILISGSISDIIHLFKICPDRTKFMNMIYEDLLAYYSPEYLQQLINLHIMERNDFSISYRDKVVNTLTDITLDYISLLHCDLFTYSLNHRFEIIDEMVPETDKYYKMDNKDVNYLCHNFKDAFDKLNISFVHLSKVLNISFFIYRQPIDEITKFINVNNIKKYTLFRTINIMGKTQQDVVLVTMSLYEFMALYRLYKYDNPELFDLQSPAFKAIINDIESLSSYIHNTMLNDIDEEFVETKDFKPSFSNEKSDRIEDIDEEFVKTITETERIQEEAKANGEYEEEPNTFEDTPEEKKEVEIGSLLTKNNGANLFRDVKNPSIPNYNEPKDKEYKKVASDSFFSRLKNVFFPKK